MLGRFWVRNFRLQFTSDTWTNKGSSINYVTLSKGNLSRCQSKKIIIIIIILREYESIHRLDDLRVFYRLKVKTTPGKGATKVGLKKIDFDFLCGNGLERTTKTILAGIFTDITLFTPYERGESLWWNFFIRFFSGKWFTRDYEDDLCRNFCCHNIFPPLFGDWNLGVKLSIRLFFVKMAR